jgi:predicted ester cyclase
MKMEEENKKIIHRLTEVFNKGDLAPVDDFIDTNWVSHQPGGVELKGPEGVKQFVTMIRTAFPDFHVTIDDMVAEGDKVALRYTWRGTHKGDFMGIAPTGKQVTGTGIDICRYAGGKEVEVWENPDRLGMLQQIGVVTTMG